MGKQRKDVDKIKEQPVTYDVYAEMPDDGQRYEVIDGNTSCATCSRVKIAFIRTNCRVLLLQLAICLQILFIDSD